MDSIAAFQGGRNGEGVEIVPVGVAITVNDNGGFFNSTVAASGAHWLIGPRRYTGGTPQAQASILIHELAHINIGVAGGFKFDTGNNVAGRENDAAVDEHCGNLIRSLR